MIGLPKCVTVESRTQIPPNSPCIFPFIYNNVTYTQCTWDSAHKTNNKPWCSGEVDAKGNHLTGERKWGNCAANCPVSPKRMFFLRLQFIRYYTLEIIITYAISVPKIVANH